MFYILALLERSTVDVFSFNTGEFFSLLLLSIIGLIKWELDKFFAVFGEIFLIKLEFVEITSGFWAIFAFRVIYYKANLYLSLIQSLN